MIIEMLFCLFLHKNTCCGCSLEVPHRGAPNEYPQHMLLRRTDEKFAFDELQIHDLAFFFFWNMDISAKRHVRWTRTDINKCMCRDGSDFLLHASSLNFLLHTETVEAGQR